MNQKQLQEHKDPATRLVGFAWFVVVFNVLVIVVGAVVRATGSGAGCGPSWPTCLGEVIPDLEGDTLIEFAHRALSGVALILVGILTLTVWRDTDKGHPARTGAVLSSVAIVVEALIGATIVLAEWVADDASVARVIAVPLHLVNTLFLLAALALTIFWLSGGGRLSWSSPQRRWVIWGAAALIALAATGAVTALADTLFPLTGDFADEAHFLTGLRIVHPILALIVIVAAWILVARSGLPPNRGAQAIPFLVGGMATTGVLNIALGLPMAVRLTHLVLADALWITFVLLAARHLAANSAQSLSR